MHAVVLDLCGRCEGQVGNLHPRQLNGCGAMCKQGGRQRGVTIERLRAENLPGQRYAQQWGNSVDSAVFVLQYLVAKWKYANSEG